MTNGKNKGMAWFFAWVTVTKAWTLHYGGRDGSSLEPQAHNLKDKTTGTEYPSQAFTHCHLKKRPKTIIICDGGCIPVKEVPSLISHKQNDDSR